VVDSTNINQFLQLPKNTIGVDAQTGNLSLPDRALNEGYVVSEQPEEPVIPGMEADLSPEAKQLFISKITNKKGQPIKIGAEVAQGQIAFDVLKANDFLLPKAGNFTEFFNNLTPRALATVSALLQKEPETPNIEKLIKDIAGTEISKTEPSKKGLRTDFEIPQSHWSKFARQYGQKQIVLEFSDEKIDNILENAVKSIDASITDIFNNLADFTSTLQTYLTSTKSNRGLKGQEAVELAKKLKPSTEKVVRDEK
jgi:antitoxin component HigA of HigAB toxin-antitoxin module